MWRSRHQSADAADFGGRVALVTGASGGIGRQTALLLGTLGATIVGVGRNERALADLEARVGGTHVVADLAGATLATRSRVGIQFAWRLTRLP